MKELCLDKFSDLIKKELLNLDVLNNLKIHDVRIIDNKCFVLLNLRSNSLKENCSEEEFRRGGEWDNHNLSIITSHLEKPFPFTANWIDRTKTKYALYEDGYNPKKGISVRYLDLKTSEIKSQYLTELQTDK